MRKLILRCPLSFGANVLFSAAVRDLHRLHRGSFVTDVRSTWAELWQHNPHVTRLNEYDPEVTILTCGQALCEQSNTAGCHALHGFLEFFNRALGTRLRPTEFKGDIHLSRRENTAPSLVAELCGAEVPFWLISTGGKLDHTVKWWDPARCQQVVDSFRGRILFVQVGHAADHHPKLLNVIDLRGRTTVRELVRLVHHAQGVLCGTDGLMHLAAAVRVKAPAAPTRRCVVIAGGREPSHWNAYPGHQFIHTVGMLPCCANGGCWKSRAVPLGDSEQHDAQLCVDVRRGLPRCMDLISSDEVIRRVESYFEGGVSQYLTKAEAKAASRAVNSTVFLPKAKTAVPRPRADFPSRGAPGANGALLNPITARGASEAFVATLCEYPGGYQGRGVVICGGGPRLFTNAWVCIQMLRRVGCALPVQFWHMGPEELDHRMRELLAPLGVECIDAFEMRQRHPARLRHGWPLKAYALLHSAFEEVLLLDADNVPVNNPELLFDAPQFRRTGAVFWPDIVPNGPSPGAWRIFGVPYRSEPEFESGQIVVNKKKCWKALCLAHWYNDHCEFYYEHVYGDKETFHMAFRKLNQPFSMPERRPTVLPGAICHNDFNGRRLFQHRVWAKWTLFPVNRRVRGFLFERECLGYLDQLRRLWDGRIAATAHPAARENLAPKLEVHSHREAKLMACMASCQPRDALRAQTLRRLRETDWGDDPVRVLMDQRQLPSAVENLTHTVWRALREFLDSDADYVLCLEDDLEFNRHIRHNLRAWTALQARQVSMGTLYNPVRRELSWDLPHATVELDTMSFFGSQALIISRAAAEYFLTHWFEASPHIDLKLAALVHHAGWKLRAHCPSLVQHVGRRSVWGGQFHRAGDFDRCWKAPALQRR